MKQTSIWAIVLLLAAFICSCSQKQEDNNFEITNGVNISHWLSQSNARGPERAAKLTDADIQYIASLGFDHLRLPIDEEQMFSETGEPEPEAFALLHSALESCQKYNLKALVDLHILRSHHFVAEVRPLFTDPAAQETFFECWRKLSAELSKYPNNMVAYELMNEPVADDPEIWNVLVNKCAQVVRELEPNRTIFIGPNLWQSYETAKDLRLPENDPHIVLSFHYYNPFLLTHYEGSWTQNKDYHSGVQYPGKLISDEVFDSLAPFMAEYPEDLQNLIKSNHEQEYNIDVIRGHFAQVAEAAKKYGVKVYCGEYGCINAAPVADRNRWFSDMTQLFNEFGYGRAIWDYQGGFGIKKDGAPAEDIIKILTEK